ncbi:uncharacterized protein LOC119575898 [Penaeus monodon]|uniref:uncharacterized protein LOC119575898 n=1 Tax=Penaeus monodon TaxID=6687 RepID=UPI0018A7B204|nr:uncharacterized protein LOC119575898 [Penaeus monodon]
MLRHQELIFSSIRRFLFYATSCDRIIGCRSHHRVFQHKFSIPEQHTNDALSAICGTSLERLVSRWKESREIKGLAEEVRPTKAVLERAIELQKDLYVCFIDYTKAFDKVQHEELFNMLRSLNLDEKDLRVLHNLY